MSELEIGEVSRRTGLPASTLRYYEERGLIRSTGRLGLKRLFRADVIQQLSLIALGRTAGFSLDEIARMFSSDGDPLIDRQQLRAKADELDLAVRRLSAVRNGLRHAADCTAASHMECPTFQRLLKIVERRFSGSPARQTRPR